MSETGPKMRRRFAVKLGSGRTGHKTLRLQKPKPANPAPAAPSRLARMLALAHHYDDMIREGVVEDQAEIARLMRVTRARVTQVMNLLNLAPDVQEEILFGRAGPGRKRELSERHARTIALTEDWAQQRRAWRGATAELDAPTRARRS